MIHGDQDILTQQGLPDIDCVIIGVNSEKTLERCLRSIFSGSYPEQKMHVIYSDGGSTDKSVAIARNFSQVKVVELHPEYPTPGLGRNAGWKAGSSPYVQFLDSDTIMDPEWLRSSIQAMENPAVGAVRGYIRELHPERSVFNWIGDLEWNINPGECDSFGGNVLIRRTALDATGGYDEELVGGEDPELSWRIGQKKWIIIMLDALLAHHDLAMFTTTQYFRRSLRSGYAFAAVQSRVSNTGSTFWKTEQQRIMLKGGGFFTFLLAGTALLLLNQSVFVFSVSMLSIAAGFIMLLRPRLLKIDDFMREKKLNRKDAQKYAWHCSLVVIPQLFGIIRFYTGQLFNKPLKNKRRSLKTRLSTPP